VRREGLAVARPGQRAPKLVPAIGHPRSNVRSGPVEGQTTGEDIRMKVTALAGGVGAGKFLRGLARVVPGRDLTAIVNTGDDVVVHGLRVSPDLDSVAYWLGDRADRERGWGRAGESFR